MLGITARRVNDQSANTAVATLPRPAGTFSVSSGLVYLAVSLSYCCISNPSSLEKCHLVEFQLKRSQKVILAVVKSYVLD